MPRRRATDRVGPVKTRTRSGCKECRASRVRCDEKKPSCTRCWERGLNCSTQLVLKWESEFVSRGLTFGRAGVWSKDKPKKASVSASPGGSSSIPPDSNTVLRQWCPVPEVRAWAFVNSGVSTFEEPHRVQVVGPDDLNAMAVFPRSGGQHDGRIIKGLPMNNSPAKALALFPRISGSDQARLFDYYLQQVCPRTTPSAKSSSPFASVILPFCLAASPTLFTAIQALGACHWSRFDSTYSAVALRFKAAALRDLRRRLATEGPWTCSTDPELLVVMMMLCLYEIVDNCDQHWTIHLRGAKELIRLRRQRQQQAVDISQSRAAALDPVTAFAELFFAFQDVMGRTACGEEVVFGSDYWQENEGNTVDLWMGCSPELVSILSSITELSRTRRQLTSDPARARFSLRAASLGRRLEHLVQQVDDPEDETLQTVAELKRLAAVVYLHCALYGATPSTPLVVGCVRTILRRVSQLLDGGSSMAGVTWPVFVAAVELDPSHDELWSDGGTVICGRPLVLRALAAMAEASVCNVARTRAVIVQVWQERDGDLLKGSRVDGTNDWEWYVAPISTAMSLA